MWPIPINKKQLAAALAIGLVSILGDRNMENEKHYVVVAITDNLTHALIGIFTYFGAFVNKTSHNNFYFVFEILLCGFFSSVIDADHFIAAKSLRLKDATNLKSRPFMHCTTLVIVIVSAVLLLSYLTKMNWLLKFGWILAAAFLAHHIRDSKRRGFWIWPLGHTPPLTSSVHLLAQMLFPYFLSIIATRFLQTEFVKVESRTAELV